MQQPLFMPDSDWTVPNLNDLPSWAGAKRIGIDTETTPFLDDVGIGVRHGGFMAGISFCIEDDRSYYLPFSHLGGDNMDKEQVLNYVRDQAASYKGTIVGTNLQYDLDFLAQEDVLFPEVDWFRDIQVADPLINELHFRYSMDAIAGRYNLPKKDEQLLKEAAALYKLHPKKEMWKLPARYVGEYAQWDAELPLKILRRQERIIDDENLWQIYDLESRVLPVLLKLRRRGVKIDVAHLEHVEYWSLREEAEALRLVKAKTGYDVGVGNVWKADAMAEPLRRLGVTIPMTTGKKPQPSITQDLLKSLDHEVGDALLHARKVNKLRTTFAASVRTHMVNGRVHCTFNQLKRERENEDGTKGAAFGRLSCEHPNLQQQPARSYNFGPFWRKVYIPDREDQLWCANDYSQQEPKIAVDVAERCKLPGAMEMADRYRQDPSTDNHTMMARIIASETEEWTPEHGVRKKAKDIFLGLCYGMGGAKLARALGLPTRWVLQHKRVTHYYDTQSEAIEGKRSKGGEGRVWEAAGEEAQEVLDTFDRKVPWVRRLATRVKKAAQRDGYVTTICGRRLRFPQDENGNYDWLHKALNKYVQGSAGDQTKTALVALDDAGHYVQLQIHDEIDGSVDDREVARDQADIMSSCLKLTVPSKVDTELGKSWGDSM